MNNSGINQKDLEKINARIERCRVKVIETAKEIRSHFFRNNFNARNDLLRIFRESLRVHGRSKEITGFRVDLALARSKLMGLITEFYINTELLDESSSSAKGERPRSATEKELLLAHLENIFAGEKNGLGTIVSFLETSR